MPSHELTQTAVERRGVRVLVVGPDGSGKSTLLDYLQTELTEQGWAQVRTHFRPRVVSGSGAAVAPHTRAAHQPLIGAARVVVRALEFWRGFAGVWRRTPNTVTIVERGWHDQLVDPRRYRLDARLRHIVSVLGYLMPQHDLVVLCQGDPAEIARRKAELAADEVARQISSWQQLAPKAGRSVLTLEATSNTPSSLAGHVGETLADIAASTWRRVPLVPTRLHMHYAGRGVSAVKALRLYQPMSTGGKMAKTAATPMVLLGFGARGAVGPEYLRELQHAGLVSPPYTAIRSNGQRAYVLRTSRSILKVAAADDSDLEAEIRALTSLPSRVGPARVPRLLKVHRGATGNALETDLFPGKVALRGADAIALKVSLVLAQLRVVHGDFTPWNMLKHRREWCLIDWQRSSTVLAPGWDLFVWHSQSARHLRGLSPQTVAERATSQHGWLTVYARETGHPRVEIQTAISDQLAQWHNVRDNDLRFARAVLRHLETYP